MNKNVRQYLKVGINMLVALLVIILCIYVLPKLMVFFLPLLIGWIIALIANKPVQFFEEKLKIKRKAMSAVVIVLVIGLVILVLYGVISVLAKQTVEFVQELPDKWETFKEDFKAGEDGLGALYENLPKDAKNIVQKIGSGLTDSLGTLVAKFSTPAVTAIGNFALSLPNLLICAIMCVLSAYFFVADRGYINSFCKRIVPKNIQERWKIVSTSLSKAVGGYFLAQFKIEFWIYLMLVVGFLIMRVDYVLLVALGIAFLDLLPFFGTGTVMVPWALIEFINRDYVIAIGILVLWAVTQLVRQLIQPKIMGAEVGLSPIPTIFLLFIGYRVGGVLGMIAALPIGIIIMNLNNEGVFDTPKNSVKLFVKKLNAFRKLDKEDLDYINEGSKEDDTQL